MTEYWEEEEGFFDLPSVIVLASSIFIAVIVSKWVHEAWFQSTKRELEAQWRRTDNFQKARQGKAPPNPRADHAAIVAQSLAGRVENLKEFEAQMHDQIQQMESRLNSLVDQIGSVGGELQEQVRNRLTEAEQAMLSDAAVGNISGEQPLTSSEEEDSS